MIAVPHFFFWPFDVGSSETDRRRARAKTHITDALRLGVLAEDEGAELRIEGHLMTCEFCGERSLSIWDKTSSAGDLEAPADPVSCPEARNAVFRLLEEGRTLTDPVVEHLHSCQACYDHLVDPAKARFSRDDGDAVGALD